MSAESAGVPGEGSTFRLRARVTAAASEAVPSSVAARFSLEGRRVLVVDDNATNLRILAAQLDRLGMLVTATLSPLEARTLASAADGFDVVVSDHRMPELDGLALAAAIESSGPGAAPVIVLSSVGERERNRPGVAAFLTKPVKPAALRDAIITILSGAVVAPQASAPRRFAADPELGRRHPHRILLAEDTLFNQKLALKLLERMGYTADLARDGTEAVDALEHDGAYDLVLMDVQMPEMDGLEATRVIRARWPERALRIVGLTANAMEGDREACLGAGMDDYLAKPIRPDELAAALAAAPSPAPVTEAS
jgi:CheY-like chemotaxis protein